MAKNFIIILLLLISSNVWAAPSTTMSITPVAVSGTTISASDENARNSEVSSKYNNHDHTDISTVGNTLSVGDGNAGNKTIQANTDDANKPYIRWDDTNSIWVSSRDGVTVQTFMIMTGADVQTSILPQSPSSGNTLQYDSTDDQWEAQTLTVAGGGTGTTSLTDGGVLLGSGTGAVTPMSVLSNGTIIVGDGSTDPTTLDLLTTSAGTLKHEYGGIEADISAIAKGGLVTGTGTGTMGVKAVGSNNEILMADSSIAGGVDWVYGLTHVSSTAMTAGTNSGDITIATGSRYLILLEGIQNTSTGDVMLRVNSDSTANAYQHRIDKMFFSAAADATVKTENGTEILIADNTDANSMVKAQFFIDTTERNDTHFFVSGFSHYRDSDRVYATFAGQWELDAAITSFEIVISAGTFTGNIYVYKLSG